MAYWFYTPYVNEGRDFGSPLFNRLQPKVGVSVLVTDGVPVEMRYPTQDDLAAADYYFLGGSVYEVTSEQRATLEAAGYTVVSDYLSGYGEGGYRAGYDG